jgi:hypothetical protein
MRNKRWNHNTRCRAPHLCARPLSCTCVDTNHFGNLWTLLPWADPDLQGGALWQLAVPCCLQLTDVHECLGPISNADKSKAFLGIELFDDRCDGLRRLERARP